MVTRTWLALAILFLTGCSGPKEIWKIALPAAPAADLATVSGVVCAVVKGGMCVGVEAASGKVTWETQLPAAGDDRYQTWTADGKVYVKSVRGVAAIDPASGKLEPMTQSQPLQDDKVVCRLEKDFFLRVFDRGG